MIRSAVIVLALLRASIAAAQSVSTTAPDIPEPGSVEAIASATGDPHFLSPWVSYLPQSSTVPSPRAFLGPVPPVNSPAPSRPMLTSVPSPPRLAFTSLPSATVKRAAKS